MYILKGFHKLHERGKKTHAHRKKIQVVHKYYCDQIQTKSVKSTQKQAMSL